MRVRALDSNGDWTFGGGENNYLVNNAAVAQDIQTRCLSFLGNCFFDAGAGIDWLTYLGGSKAPLTLQLALQMTILNTPDENGNPVVTGINQVSVGLNDVTRQFSVSYQAQTIYSTTQGQFVYNLGGSV